MGAPMNIAVVDAGGHLIAFARMDKRCPMPMIDVYAQSDTFADPHGLAARLAETLMGIEQVPNIPMFHSWSGHVPCPTGRNQAGALPAAAGRVVRPARSGGGGGARGPAVSSAVVSMSQDRRNGQGWRCSWAAGWGDDRRSPPRGPTVGAAPGQPTTCGPRSSYSCADSFAVQSYLS
jgi:hypothetical protein